MSSRKKILMDVKSQNNFDEASGRVDIQEVSTQEDSSLSAEASCEAGLQHLAIPLLANVLTPTIWPDPK